MPGTSLESKFEAIVGPDGVGDAGDVRFQHDATESQGVSGTPDAVVLPASAEEVAAVVSWCYEHDVAIVPRGGGTGFAGGCVPVAGGVVLALDRMTKVRSFDPLLWRINVEAGLRTGEVRRLARENGLMFPPDPGAAEQSQIGGNIATNAGGPHAFKYGVTGRWVTGIEAVVAPGEIVEVGGPITKDVAGYDLKSLLIGSEGTLGIITAAWLRLIPAPEAALPIAAFYRSAADGCAAIEAIVGSGCQPAAIEFLDRGAIDAARLSWPGGTVPTDASFLVVAEADGSPEQATATMAELREVMSGDALAVHAPTGAGEIAALWRWRDGVSGAVEAVHGGKVSEDVAVPLDRLLELIDATVKIGSDHDLDACSWGHAGDGNLHSSFLVDHRDPNQLERARSATAALYALTAAANGTISGEHGLGSVKRHHLDLQSSPAVLALNRALKQTLDPKNLLNPDKKI